MSYLLDTNVLSEFARPLPDPNVTRWASSLSAFAMSTISLEEVFYGLAAEPNPRILAWLESFLSRRCRVLDVTPSVARQAGQLRGSLGARGRVRAQADMLIAATAAQHGLTLATRNEKDFRDCGIAVLNPFRAVAER